MTDMSGERMHSHLSKDNTYMEFENPNEVEKALKPMDGGQIDAQESTATAVLVPWPWPAPPQFQSVLSGECYYHLPHGTGHSHG